MIKQYLKNIKIIRYLYINLIEIFACILTIISPKLNTEFRYWMKYKQRINLISPTTFNEKLLWLKLNRYMNDPLVIQCADKLKVRTYVRDCGYGHILNDLIGVYDNADEIPWDKLPQQFVLKWNFGAGMNVICRDKNGINQRDVIKKMKKWGKNKYWLPYSEMQYKYCDKKIICEKYLGVDTAENEVIPDYKVYCFHGMPLCILVMHDRGSETKTEFFDSEWNELENTSKYKKPDVLSSKPECLSEMLDASASLSSRFPFVRCDFYVVSGKLYFGELTFTPAGGLYTSETVIHGKSMSECLEINI